MLTRGYFIGEIVDALSDVSGQVSTRGKLGLTDLNKYLEDFIKTTLNHLWSLTLRNLNEERSNFPGLDLGDETSGWAFQVTAERTSGKVNETLAKLTQEQLDAFPTIKVLILGSKQGSYTLDPDQCARIGFKEEDIWDIHVLCKRCMDLPVDVLQTLYNHVRAELARVRIELEIPDENGRFQTNVADYIEAIPKPRMSDLSKFKAYLRAEGLDDLTGKGEADFKRVSENLAKLPRITREFLTMMIERRETEQRRGSTWHGMEINVDRLDRISGYPDSEGEVRLLREYNFIDLSDPDDENNSRYWHIYFAGTSEGFENELVDYAKQNGIPLARPLVNLDFSEF